MGLVQPPLEIIQNVRRKGDGRIQMIQSKVPFVVKDSMKGPNMSLTKGCDRNQRKPHSQKWQNITSWKWMSRQSIAISPFRWAWLTWVLKKMPTQTRYLEGKRKMPPIWSIIPSKQLQEEADKHDKPILIRNKWEKSSSPCRNENTR